MLIKATLFVWLAGAGPWAARVLQRRRCAGREGLGPAGGERPAPELHCGRGQAKGQAEEGQQEGAPYGLEQEIRDLQQLLSLKRFNTLSWKREKRGRRRHFYSLRIRQQTSSWWIEKESEWTWTWTSEGEGVKVRKAEVGGWRWINVNGRLRQEVSVKSLEWRHVTDMSLYVKERKREKEDSPACSNFNILKGNIKSVSSQDSPEWILLLNPSHFIV